MPLMILRCSDGAIGCIADRFYAAFFEKQKNRIIRSGICDSQENQADP